VWLVATLRGPSRSLIWFAVGAATVALASPVLIDMTRSVATEAITWGVAFTLLALAGFLAWRRDGREAWLVLVAVALALGANARPGVAVAGPVLALAVLASGGSGGRGSRPHGEGGHGFGLWRRPWTLWLTAAAIAVVPLFGLLSVFWLKFRQFIPDWTMHEAYPEKEMYATAMAASGGQLAGLPFLPTVTAFYLRPFGVGMTEEFVKTRLFRPFSSTKASGMGIGSFESLQYIRELGGSIDVVSAPGRGTVVTMLLPLFDTTASSDARRALQA